MTETIYHEVPYKDARAFCVTLFGAYGFPQDDAEAITDVLLRADLYGIESHGVQRLIRYHNDINNGHIDVKARCAVVHDAGLAAVIDGRKAMGQLTGLTAMKLAIAKAKEHGVGMVSVRNSNHYGIAGFYSEMALEHDLIGVSMTNTEAICVPTHGKAAMLGTSPIAFAMPADPVPFCYDAATTVVPRGKLEVYNKKSGVIPSGWALDAAGHDTTDAGLVLANIIGKLGGGIAPLGGVGELSGGHKGYGLSLMVDIFCGVLSGGATSNHVNTRPGEEEIGHFFAAFDYGLFGDKSSIKKRLSVFLDELRASPKADGQARIYTHGEKEHELQEKRKKGTIPVNDKTLAEMQTIAQELDIPFLTLNSYSRST